jgi:hypothetical protein
LRGLLALIPLFSVYYLDLSPNWLLIPLFEGVAVTVIVTDGVVAFELDFQFAKSKFKSDYPVCSTKRCIHPFEEGEFYFPAKTITIMV